MTGDLIQKDPSKRPTLVPVEPTSYLVGPLVYFDRKLKKREEGLVERLLMQKYNILDVVLLDRYGRVKHWYNMADCTPWQIRWVRFRVWVNRLAHMLISGWPEKD